MCGIVGYVGPREVLPLILQGLKTLEYRGYDSAGIVILGEDLSLFKRQGKINALEKDLQGLHLDGRTGIGHTRWATHGAPTELNAHPHLDCDGNLAVIHNGIIENYLQLKAELLRLGHHFRSETDTEVIPHLIEEQLKSQSSLLGATLAASAQMEGAFALAVVSKRFPNQIVAVRRESPLVLGVGKGENFLASDIPALLPYTRDILILNNNEAALIEESGIQLFTLEGKALQRQPLSIDWDAKMAERGGYEHYMLKEIHEQPQALRETMVGHIDWDHSLVLLPEFPDDLLTGARRLYISACGTAYHAGIAGKYLIESLAGLPVEVEIASEFRYRRTPFVEGSLGLVISQSGETMDTLAALKRFKEQGIPTLAITNVQGSSVCREADHIFYTKAGPEIAVASTKAYLTQVLSLILLAVKLSQLKGQPQPELVCELKRIPLLAERVLAELEKTVQEYANRMRFLDDYFILGRGLDFASALEGALKLKEISYVHCEAYAAGELKHGPLALVTQGKQVCILATQRNLFAKTLSNLKEVKARGAEVLALSFPDGNELEADEIWSLPPTLDPLGPLLSMIPLQLFAYYMAKEKGCDIDQPRNLAKSVTVE
ncbi:MAG: glutamine--fructose-6-phosphate transaminase (isomerizing) [Coprothermobacterota bacterium]|nr:glutamine--fructose-6-phosphate transaminase (isomerizing) [Coprothermobacterota bacterium]